MTPWTDAYAIRHWFGYLASESGYFVVCTAFLVAVAVVGALKRDGRL